MQVENHSLVKELPEYKDRIHQLKMSDHHFQKLFDEYHTIDKEIHRLETEESPKTDEYMEDIKKQRLHLKDQLYVLLQKAN